MKGICHRLVRFNTENLATSLRQKESRFVQTDKARCAVRHWQAVYNLVEAIDHVGYELTSLIHRGPCGQIIDDLQPTLNDVLSCRTVVVGADDPTREPCNRSEQIALTIKDDHRHME